MGMMLSLITPWQVQASEGETETYDSNGELKIASYNIAEKGTKTTEIGNFITAEGIDIIGFQEVDKNTSRSGK